MKVVTLYICSRGIGFVYISTIFLIDFRTVSNVWYFFYKILDKYPLSNLRKIDFLLTRAVIFFAENITMFIVTKTEFVSDRTEVRKK
jgi:hypothetical protein